MASRRIQLSIITVIFIFLSIAQVSFMTKNVGTRPSVSLERGREGRLPCKVNFTIYNINWSKGRPVVYPDNATLIFMDLYFDIDTKGGKGYDGGRFDIADDFSLIIKNVTLRDEGQYFCVAVDSSTGNQFWGGSNVTVYVLPKSPFPQIKECMSNSSGTPDSQDCVLNTPGGRDYTANLTCNVDGYYPNLTMCFRYRSGIVPVIHTKEWRNSDGTRGRSITILANTSSEPYTCVVTDDLEVFGGLEESSSTIRVTWTPGSFQVKHNRLREILIILVLFFISTIVPVFLFLGLTKDVKLCMGSRTQAPEEQIANELRQFYNGKYKEIRTVPLQPGIYFHIRQIFTDVILLKESVPLREDQHVTTEEEFKDESTIKEKLYMDDFINKILLGSTSSHIIMDGDAGMGKTTFLLKLVDEWVRPDCQLLKNFKLLFYIPLSVVEKIKDIKLFYQSITSDATAKCGGLKKYIKQHQNEVLFLFDGLDEFHGDLKQNDPDNEFVQILRGVKYPNSKVIVTTGPWRKGDILADEKLRRLFTRVTLKGFNHNNTKLYVRKFFCLNTDSTESLVQFLEEDHIIFSKVISSSPIYLSMVCIMWQNPQRREEIKKLQTVSRLMSFLVNTLKEHYAKCNRDHVLEPVNQSLIQVGRIAFTTIVEGKHIFGITEHKDFSNAIETAQKVGVLVRAATGAHYLSHQQNTETRYRFSHMLVQGYLAALYLESEQSKGEVGKRNFDEALRILSKEIGRYHRVKFAYLWQFIASRGEDMSRRVLDVLGQANRVTQNIRVQVAFECHDKDITDQFTASLFPKGQALRFDKSKALAAYLYVLANNKAELEYLHHFTDVLGPSVSEQYAEVVFSLTRLKVLRLVDVQMDDNFYRTMAQKARLSKIETLVISNLKMELSEESSHHLADAILSIPTLRNLHLMAGLLHDKFYETFNEAITNTKPKIKKLWFAMEKGGPQMKVFVTSLLETEYLKTVGLSFKPMDDTFANFPSRSKNYKTEKLRIAKASSLSEEASRNLAKGVGAMPKLQALYILDPGKHLLDGLSSTCMECDYLSQMSTLILRDATLSRSQLQTLLSPEGLSNVRFTSIWADDGWAAGSLDEPKHTRDLKELRVDDASLLQLLKLGIHYLCPRIETLQLDITSDFITNVFKTLRQFESVTNVSVVAFRKPTYFYCSNITLRHYSIMRALMESLSNIRTEHLGIFDINIGDEGAKKLLRLAGSQEKPAKVSQTQRRTETKRDTQSISSV